MRRTSYWRGLCVILALTFALITTNSTVAQQDLVIVPDLIGLTTPQAARAAADAALLFASESSTSWTDDAELPPNLVSQQEPTPGQNVKPGSPVKVIVPRVFNIELVYDAKSLNLINLSDSPLNLAGLSFRSGEGTTLREYRSPNPGTQLLPRNCVRLWALRPQASEQPAGCTAVSTSNTIRLERQLFWLGAVDSFSIQRNGDLIETCPITANRCLFMLPQGDDPERTPYLSFAYRTNYLTIRNESERWMSVAGVEAIGWSGKRFRFDDLQNLAPGEVPWTGTRLGPGQCIVYSELAPAVLPPYDCQVVGYIRLPSVLPFWSTGFTVISPTGRRSPTCAAPGRGQLSLCLVRK
jgi:hypothetical protein